MDKLHSAAQTMDTALTGSHDEVGGEYFEKEWKIQEKRSPKESPKHKIANAAGSVWLSLFMDGSVKSSYRPRPLAPS